MDMDMNMEVFVSFALLYIAARIGEKVVGKIGDFVVDALEDYFREYVVAPIKYYLLAPIGRRLRCLLCFRTQVKKLKKTRAKVQELLNDAEKNGEVGLPRVQKWLTSANQIIKDTENLFVEKRQLNLKLCYQRSRMAMEKKSVVDKLIRKGSSFLRTHKVSIFESRRLILKKIMEGLEDDEINMIGIYGEGGVGKTDLVREVAQEAKYDNQFDEVVIATVSSEPNLEGIHWEIAHMLGLRFDWNGSAAGRAQQFLARLLDRNKRILVILDDIWEKVDLVAIGIPFGEEHKGGCKVVLTSRSKDVCDETGSEMDFSIEVLSDKEGWNLFRKLARDSVDSPNRNNSAVECAGKCGGLPIAIVQAARGWRKRFYEVQDVQVAKAKFSKVELKKEEPKRKEKFSKGDEKPPPCIPYMDYQYEDYEAESEDEDYEAESEDEDYEAKSEDVEEMFGLEGEIEVVEEMLGLDPPMPSPSVNNNDNSPHSSGSSTYQNYRGGLSTRCDRCQLIWARDNSMANYQKLLRGEHI